MEIVKFNTSTEFLEELEKEKGNVHRCIVRVTQESSPGSMPIMKRLCLIATFIVVASSPTYPCAGKQIVKLQQQMGSVMMVDGEPADQVSIDTLKNLNELTDVFIKRIKDMGFEVRQGVFEPAGVVPSE